MRRFALFAASVLFAGAQTAHAQPCWSPAPGMTMCADGFMSMGGMWMRPPPFTGAFPDAATARAPAATRWSRNWRVDPDGTRHETWEHETTMPDGRTARDRWTRTVTPDGRTCMRRGGQETCR